PGRVAATAARGVGALLALVIGLAGPPWALSVLVGWPIPSWGQLTAWVQRSDGRSPDAHTAVQVLACVMWLVWAAFALLVIAEILATLTRLRLPRPRLVAPLGQVVTSLLGGAVLAASAVRAGLPTPPPPLTAPQLEPPPPGHSEAQVPPPLPAGQVTMLVGDQRYTHTVVRGDNLSTIAEHWLGDANRWPELYALNRGRHWPVGGQLRDPDLIFPGWVLDLPADAHPPGAAPPATPAPSAPPPPVAPTPQPSGGTTAPTSAPPAATAPAEDPDGVVPDAPTPTGSPTGSPAQTPTVSPDTPGSPDAATPPATEPTATRAPDGIDLPGGSFLPWSLAAAITAAAAAVWLQRRRHFRPQTNPPEPLVPLPAAVTDIQRLTHQHTPPPADEGEQAAAVPPQPPPPTGGIGLRGAGAAAAARAALVTALAAGGPADPDGRVEVIIDTATVSTLFATTPPAFLAADRPSWPRLHLVADLDHALTLIDTRLLHRARILDEHSLTDLGTLLQQVPDEEALPPILLICHAPPPEATMRTRTSLSLGIDLGVSALLLGQWAPASVEVAADGRTSADTATVEAVGERMAVLDTATALAILVTLHEAQTGHRATRTGAEPDAAAAQRPPLDHPVAGPGPGAEHPADTEPLRRPDQPPPTPDPPPGDETPRTKARLRVLGTPQVEDVTRPGRPLRGKAAEMAVYLACHPDGADTETIAEYLVPEVRRRQARQQVHTNASNLRHVLGRAGGPVIGGYVLKRGTTARYRLDPTTVAVDLWQVHELLGRAQLASAPTRTDLLRQACEIYTAPMAHGCDYEWIEPHREKARRWGTEAHLLLADDLLESDPQAASDLLGKAIGLDRYNEELYRKAMHARHRLGDADGIRALLRALTKALADLDAEPDDATTELAATLRTSLEQR
ncbi:MAG: LysM peptidoglycan-binding domain-containing protein, partial [Dactylosporangium sp.]|nr:LysM peptidoglycan-binding domain-containing protein [Dactylosporangium sp.]